MNIFKILRKVYHMLFILYTINSLDVPSDDVSPLKLKQNICQHFIERFQAL